jgi:hypothetical protein
MRRTPLDCARTRGRGAPDRDGSGRLIETYGQRLGSRGRVGTLERHLRPMSRTPDEIEASLLISRRHRRTCLQLQGRSRRRPRWSLAESTRRRPATSPWPTQDNVMLRYLLVKAEQSKPLAWIYGRPFCSWQSTHGSREASRTMTGVRRTAKRANVASSSMPPHWRICRLFGPPMRRR